MRNVFHPDRRIFKNLRVVQNQFPAHKCNIIRRRIMIIGICQTTAVNKMCILHSQLICPFVHLLHKVLLAARDMLCHRNTRIIARSHYDAFDHGFHILCFSLFQKHLGATHGSGMCTCRHRIGKTQISTFQMIKDQKKCHDLCNTCRTSSGIFVLFIKNGFGLRLH